MQWQINSEENCKQLFDDNYVYSLGIADGRMKLLIENLTTRKCAWFNIMNKDPFFVEKEAETIIRREKENNRLP